MYYDGRLTHILNWEKVDNLPLKSQFAGLLRFDFFEESVDDIIKILKKVNNLN